MYRVLYVDDESDLLDVAKHFLELSGEFTVITCISAKTMLARGNLSLYDAIISDYQMPDMDGITFLKEVRSRYPDIPFILFTGRGREEIVIEALNSGADFYLQKGGAPKAQFTELMHKVRMSIQRRKAEQEIFVKNRLYSVLSATNKAIVHIRNKPDFFSEICRILVEIGGFRMVWIGLAVPEQKKIEPVASSGHTDGYLDSINISTEDVPRGRGPTGTAYRERKYYFSNDIKADPRMEPWRDAAIERGYLANAAFPFALGTPNAGVISLYAPEVGFFSEPVLSLLEEMSRDISFALKTIDEEERRKSAEEALQLNQDRLVKGEIISGTGTWELEVGSGEITHSPGAMAIYGIENARSTLPEIRATIPLPEYRPALKQALDEFITHGTPYNLEFKIRNQHDGSIRDINSRATYDSKNNRVLGIIHDITEQKRIEEKLIQSNRMLGISLKAANAGAWTWDFPTGVLTWSPEFFELFRLPPDAHPSFETWLATLHPDDRDPAMKKIDHSVKNHTYLWNEYRIILPDGTMRWIGAGGSTTYDNSDAPLRMSGVCIDITDRVHAEAALRESEEKYRMLIDTLNEGIWVIDQDSVTTFVNPKMEQILGYLPEEMLGKSLFSFMDDDGKRIAEHNVERRRQGIKEQHDFQFLKKDGSRIYAILEATPILGNNGEYLGAIAGVSDITERKRAEDALRESERKFSTVFLATPVSLALISAPDGAFVDVNTAFLINSGFTREEVIGKTSEELGFFPDIEEYQQMISELREHRRVEGLELQIRTKSGVTRVGRFSSEMIPMGGKPHFLSMVEDITERRDAEQALKESEERFRSLVNDLQDGVIILGFDGMAHFANPAAFRMIGLDPSDMDLPISITRFINPDSVQKVIADLNAIREGKKGLISKYRVLTVSGERKWVEASGTRINYRGSFADLVTLRDITEREEAERALFEANKKLHLLGSITRHDIRNKITVCLGYISMIKKKSADPWILEYATKLESAAHAIGSQIEFTRVYQEIGSHKPKWQNLDAVVPRSHIPETISMKAEVMVYEILADPMIEKVFFNLLDNSIRHGDHVTEINIRASPSDSILTIIWEDNGRGIPIEEKEIIFERGFGKNTGLGMFLSREILSLTGMTIKENGIPGKGARFEIVVPEGMWRSI